MTLRMDLPNTVARPAHLFVLYLFFFFPWGLELMMRRTKIRLNPENSHAVPLTMCYLLSFHIDFVPFPLHLIVNSCGYRRRWMTGLDHLRLNR